MLAGLSHISAALLLPATHTRDIICRHGGPDYLSMHYDMKRPVYVQSTWLKNRAVMDKFPMRYGFITDLLEEVSLCK
jgi:hypothetical protein